MNANNTPTVITDEELKRLKESDSDDGWHRLEATTLDALIARLEAAEKFIEVGALTQSVTPTDLAMAELKWREVSGKLEVSLEASQEQE